MKIKLCYFNQHWNVYFYTEGGCGSWLDNPETQTKQDGDRGEYRLRKYNHPEIPIYSFELWLNDASHRPGHGGEWSSNSMSINRAFGTNLLEVAVDQISVAVPVLWLKAVLGTQVTWKPDDIYGWKITGVKGAENEYDKWTELQPA